MSRNDAKRSQLPSAAMSISIDLTGEQLDELAARVARLLPDRDLVRLLTVDQLAEHLATTSEWVRRHQAELGGYRLSDGGGRSPIRFRASDVEKFLAKRRLTPPPRARFGDWRSDPDWSLG